MNDGDIKEILSLADIDIGAVTINQISGGSINQTYKLAGSGGSSHFLKLNSAKKFPQLFHLEKDGLNCLSSAGCIRTPAVRGNGIYNDWQFLVLEWIEEGERTKSFWERFGRKLAELHQSTNDKFGYETNNYMGALMQKNAFKKSWMDFFIECRVRPQIVLAIEKGNLQAGAMDAMERMKKRLGEIFAVEPPSLIHGDLWSGNYICDRKEEPVLIDPAIYFGHRSMDLGMTTLFGGFDSVFYSSYNHYFPLPANYMEQWEVCNLYPLLIHLNLFGTSYRSAVMEVLKKYGS